MAEKEIDPAVAQDLARLALQLSHDKKTRGKFGRLVREALPDSRHAQAFPEIEIEDKFETLEKERKDGEHKRAQEALIERMNKQRASLLSGGDGGNGPRYDEDTVKKIESLMEKKGITDYDDGAVLYAHENPPPAKPSVPPQVHGTTWEFPEWGKFGKDPVRASREVAADVINELQRKRA